MYAVAANTGHERAHRHDDDRGTNAQRSRKRRRALHADRPTSRRRRRGRELDRRGHDDQHVRLERDQQCDVAVDQRGISGTGNGTVTYSAAANTATARAPGH